jgi:hypothetical protein
MFKMFTFEHSLFPMKSIFLAVFLLVLSQSVFAQITIDANDLPSSGKTYYLKTDASLTGINYQAAGPNQTWNFSALTASVIDTVSYVTVGSTPFAYQFFFNNAILYPNNKADMAVRSDDFGLPPGAPVDISDVINYYKKDNDEFTLVGFGASISSIPTSVRFNPTDMLFKLPLNFNDTYAGPFQWNVSVPTVGYYGQDKQRSSVVDGWGIIQLPNNVSYPVLRIKSTITGTDTFYVDQFGFGLNVPSTQVEYIWLAKDEGAPVMQINTNQGGFGQPQISAVRYKNTDNLSSLNQEHFLKQHSLSVYPVPAHEQLTIHFQSQQSGSVAIIIQDMAGRELLRNVERVVTGKNTYQLEMADLPPGAYILTLSQDEYRASSRFLKID